MDPVRCRRASCRPASSRERTAARPDVRAHHDRRRVAASSTSTRTPLGAPARIWASRARARAANLARRRVRGELALASWNDSSCCRPLIPPDALISSVGTKPHALERDAAAFAGQLRNAERFASRLRRSTASRSSTSAARESPPPFVKAGNRDPPGIVLETARCEPTPRSGCESRLRSSPNADLPTGRAPRSPSDQSATLVVSDGVSASNTAVSEITNHVASRISPISLQAAAKLGEPISSSPSTMNLTLIAGVRAAHVGFDRRQVHQDLALVVHRAATENLAVANGAFERRRLPSSSGSAGCRRSAVDQRGRLPGASSHSPYAIGCRPFNTSPFMPSSRAVRQALATRRTSAAAPDRPRRGIAIQRLSSSRYASRVPRSKPRAAGRRSS